MASSSAPTGYVTRRQSATRLLGRRMGSIARRTRNILRTLGRRSTRPLVTILGLGVTEVDERGGTLTALPRSRGHRGIALADQPVPRLIIDNLDLAALLEVGADVSGVLVVIPLVEVDEDTPELITLLVRLWHHIDALDRAKAEVLEDRKDALLTNVLEDTGNADAEDGHCFWFLVCLKDGFAQERM